MSLLYKGNYYRRYKVISKYISGKSVTELCFGDIILAEYCKKNQISWKGIDIHANFVENALKKGFQAEKLNIIDLIEFPKADTCIIAGSLYHFKDDLPDIFRKMLLCAPTIIISEPVINLSERKGIIGKLAKASATINGNEQHFRFNLQTLTETLNTLSKKLEFSYRIAEQLNKDLIIVITK
jgi:hypothetical protein